jgi:DNA primase
MIPQQIIDQIKLTADVVEVVGDYVQLKRRGTNMIACCPFHNEKSPSFYVSASKQIYKCFGCGKAGDAVTFVKEIEGLNYGEAIRFLAKKYGIEVPEEVERTDEAQAAYTERESVLIVLNWAKNFFQEQMKTTDDGQAFGLAYFRSRGFQDKTISDFELGFSPEGRDGLLKAAKKAGHSIDLLEKAGLIIQKEDQPPIDRFRNRVMFPIYHQNGKVLGFGARMLGSDKNQPKYLNSPETQVYHKSEVLYGLFQAKQAIRQADNCYLTEGYTDVIAMSQASVKNVVASSGTSLTPDQIKVISRYTKNVTVLYDGDAAGMKASVRGIDLLLEAGMNVRALTFPDGDDPDSYLKKVGENAFEEYLKTNTTDFISFKAGLYAQEAAADPFKRASVITDMVQSIVKIPDPIARQVFYGQCAKVLNIAEELLIEEGNRMLIKGKQEAEKFSRRQQEQAERTNQLEQQALGELGAQAPDAGEYAIGAVVDPITKLIEISERESMRIIISYGSKSMMDDYTVADIYKGELEDIEFITPIYAKMFQIFLAEMQQERTPNTQFFLDHSDVEVRTETINLITTPHEPSEQWLIKKIPIVREEDVLRGAVTQDIFRMKLKKIDKVIHEIKQKIPTATEEQLEILLPNIQVLLAAKLTFAKALGRTVG